MNHTLLFAMTGFMGRTSLMDPKKNPTTDWCAKDAKCVPWKKTKAGRARFAALQKINKERKKKGLPHV